jgi:hypothetical protein
VETSVLLIVSIANPLRAQTQLVNSVGMYVMTYPLIGEGSEFETQGIILKIKCELSGIRLTGRMEGTAEVLGFPTPK